MTLNTVVSLSQYVQVLKVTCLNFPLKGRKLQHTLPYPTQWRPSTATAASRSLDRKEMAP